MLCNGLQYYYYIKLLQLVANSPGEEGALILTVMKNYCTIVVTKRSSSINKIIVLEAWCFEISSLAKYAKVHIKQSLEHLYNSNFNTRDTLVWKNRKLNLIFLFVSWVCECKTRILCFIIKIYKLDYVFERRVSFRFFTSKKCSL